MADMSAPRVVLVDASVYVFRAWHSMPDEFVDADGHPVNAVHGFLRFLLDLLQRTRPTHALVAFDEALESSFRNEFYPAYKANREPAPEELKRQFGYCRALAAALGLREMADPRFEADDLIGSALHALRPEGYRGLIVSADKDLSQLLREGDEQWDLARDTRWSAAEVHGRYGARPERIADFLGLTGDAIDNIPGVPGIGAKTASALLDHFDSLDALLERIDELPFLRIRGAKSHAARLREHRELALLSRRLATISLDAEVPGRAVDYEVAAVRGDLLDPMLDQLRVGPITRRRIADWSASLA
ncbi:5'-3' exonuclease [Pseudomarimonas salicorniae]|uniref:Exodeoxyribonuclease IX n=1 Tax=Pseudomarimonas salicorniae TaxID=2933270 RepID=A0ABT0GMS0_9GAMM|nr:5'-3' exonuclease H3TH domain-containing protein [Lysobacter sp. CAU 1642]MCK7595290.1 exodeoxyribonuclease IX [Lysobacter sp. CAU 1642]